MLSSPVGELVSELQTSEIPERIMKHGVLYSTISLDFPSYLWNSGLLIKILYTFHISHLFHAC
jgi:hypothetical protein